MTALAPIRFFLAAFAITLIGFACSKGNKDETKSSGNDAFKKSMLMNYADTLIVPAYQLLQSNVNAMEEGATTFLNAPTSANQNALRTSFQNAYVAYEGVSAAYFGPAATTQLNNTLNSFPTNTSKIESNIQTGNYNLSQIIVSDSVQGFPALDYLFFSQDAVSKFNDASSANRKKYVRDIIARMKQVISGTLTQWTGNYHDQFINSLQTNVGSSIGSLVNQFAFEMDALKGPRIGYPFGKQSNGIVFATKCEAYYSGNTKTLAIANLSSLKRYYTGAGGRGIDDYLVLLGKSQLNSTVLSQFDIALNALQAIPEPMSAAFSGSPATVEAAYKEVQKLLTLIKTDVASATAVQITYMDNDGD